MPESVGMNLMDASTQQEANTYYELFDLIGHHINKPCNVTEPEFIDIDTPEMDLYEIMKTN